MGPPAHPHPARKLLSPQQHPLPAGLRPSLPKALPPLAKPLALPARHLSRRHPSQPPASHAPPPPLSNLPLLRPPFPLPRGTRPPQNNPLPGQTYPLPV